MDVEIGDHVVFPISRKLPNVASRGVILGTPTPFGRFGIYFRNRFGCNLEAHLLRLRLCKIEDRGHGLGFDVA